MGKIFAVVLLLAIVLIPAAFAMAKRRRRKAAISELDALKVRCRAIEAPPESSALSERLAVLRRSLQLLQASINDETLKPLASAIDLAAHECRTSSETAEAVAESTRRMVAGGSPTEALESLKSDWRIAEEGLRLAESLVAAAEKARDAVGLAADRASRALRRATALDDEAHGFIADAEKSGFQVAALKRRHREADEMHAAARAALLDEKDPAAALAAAEECARLFEKLSEEVRALPARLEELKGSAASADARLGEARASLVAARLAESMLRIALRGTRDPVLGNVSVAEESLRRAETALSAARSALGRKDPDEAVRQLAEFGGCAASAAQLAQEAIRRKEALSAPAAA